MEKLNKWYFGKESRMKKLEERKWEVLDEHLCWEQFY